MLAPPLQPINSKRVSLFCTHFVPFVSCSTVTVTKCQAALKTLQTFPFFNPTCLCREPQLDQKCNSFRTFLFDHPCLFVSRREKDPYPIDSLVSCTHAHSICKSDPNCSRIYDHFKNVCRTNEDDKCLPELQEACKEAWAEIRLTPMFGCICPPNLWQGQKKCDRHFNFVNHNRCAGSDMSIETNDVLTNFQSTCYQAMEMCQKNLKCASAISAIIAYCSSGECRREKCRHSLQAFYRNKSLVKYAVEIAFCLCKKTNNSEEDACMKAQNTLHPSCAQEVDTIAQPTCHSVAEGCRGDHECAPLLEEFEQLCATDNYTKTCAGYPEQCRIGMLGILGTKLRTNCICKGTDRAKLYECVGWQRVLWFNPCVVEAQREFHMNKVRASMSLHKHSSNSISTSSSSTYAMTIPTTTTSLVVTRTTSTTTRTTIPPSTTTTTTSKPTTRAVRTTRPTTPSTTTTKLSTRATSPATSSTQSTTRTTEPNTQIFRKHSSNNGLSNVISRGRDKSAMHATQAPLNAFLTPVAEDKRRVTTLSTTTKHYNYFANLRTRARPTISPQGCTLKKTSLDEEMFVAEGKATRFYHDFENDCSELCYCAPGSLLRCQTECIQPISCKNEKAMYKHGAPSYQAFRGRCLCYSAKFICMRPKLGTYTTPPGVFLYLGYSSLDEHLLSKHVSFDIQTSVQELQELISKTLAPEASCGLSLFSVAEENVIVIAKHKNQSWDSVGQVNMNPTMEEVAQDKVSCHSSLEKLVKAVNEQHNNIKTNVFLSVFKLAEIDIIYPETSNSITIKSTLILSYFSIFTIYMVNG
ncbi:hypothetical protein V9T40_008697 [Parthenolecanium corni]|uniref:GDNF/GAS1 domain-containing protein n=1 Tax=Parthenolecanium corni TaxID=536013 RepID=A0AAN9TNL8_9HEMI